MLTPEPGISPRPWETPLTPHTPELPYRDANFTQFHYIPGQDLASEDIEEFFGWMTCVHLEGISEPIELPDPRRVAVAMEADFRLRQACAKLRAAGHPAPTADRNGHLSEEPELIEWVSARHPYTRW